MSYLQELLDRVRTGQEKDIVAVQATKKLEQIVNDIAYSRVLKVYKDEDMALNVANRVVKRIISRCRNIRQRVDLSSGFSKNPEINFKAWINEHVKFATDDYFEEKYAIIARLDNIFKDDDETKIKIEEIITQNINTIFKTKHNPYLKRAYEQFWDCFNRLKPSFQEILKVIFFNPDSQLMKKNWEHLTIKQAASYLRITEATANNRFHRAKKALKNIFEEKGIDHSFLDPSWTKWPEFINLRNALPTKKRNKRGNKNGN